MEGMFVIPARHLRPQGACPEASFSHPTAVLQQLQTSWTVALSHDNTLHVWLAVMNCCLQQIMWMEEHWPKWCASVPTILQRPKQEASTGSLRLLTSLLLNITGWLNGKYRDQWNKLKGAIPTDEWHQRHCLCLSRQKLQTMKGIQRHDRLCSIKYILNERKILIFTRNIWQAC